jgi:DNA polymerase-3 subunit epsilon
MKLTRPLVFFDVETTGVDPAKDRIVTFSALKIFVDGKSHCLNAEFNPGFAMKLEVIAIHKITNEQAALWPPFTTHAKAIWSYFQGCDLAGYNLLNFDVPILWEEFNRVGIKWDLTGVNIVDVGNIFKIKERRTLEAAVKFYCGREHSEAHGSRADAAATYAVLEGQLKRYADLSELPVSTLAQFSRMDERFDLAGKIVKDKDGDPCYAFGKSKGVKVRDDLSYAQWMLKSDFSEQTKMVLRGIIEDIQAWS